MKHLSPILALLVIGSVLAPRTVSADPRIALHVGGAPAKAGFCSSGEPATVSCPDYVTAGDLLEGYEVYVVVVDDDPFGSFRGATFGVGSTGSPGLSWEDCLGGTVTPDWPESGSGIRIFLPTHAECREDTQGEDLAVVLGRFYVYAYAPARLFLEDHPEEGGIRVTDCLLQESYLLPADTGEAVFSAGAVDPGCNPCTAFCGADPEPDDPDPPAMQLYEPVTGRFSFTSDDTISVPTLANWDLEFEVECIPGQTPASTDCADLRWRVAEAIGIEDAPWSVRGPIQDLPGFQLGLGFHVLEVEVRSEGGLTTRGTLVLDATAAAFDRELLFVDDVRDGEDPADNKRDAFWQARLAGYGELSANDIDEFEPFGPNDANPVPDPVPRARLLRYRTVVWTCDGAGMNGTTALLRATQRGDLDVYLEAGGNLWLLGPQALGSLHPISSGIGDLNYPRPILSHTPAHDRLGLRGWIDNDRSLDRARNDLRSAVPAAGMGEPLLTFDASKVGRPFRDLGVTRVDAVEADPLDLPPGFVPLYTFEALLPASPFQGKMVGGLFPRPQEAGGRVAWFGFPLWFFPNQEAQDAVDFVLDWLRGVTVAPTLGPGSADDAGWILAGPRETPFSDRARIVYRLDRAGLLQASVYDALGRRVARLLDEPRPAGEGELVWNGTDTRGAPVPNGIYYVRVRHAELTRVTKVLKLAR